MNIKNKNKLIIISSPSGAGKTTICKLLIKKMKNISLSVSYTSRSKRLNEINGKYYYFITKDKFKKLENKNFFIETTKNYIVNKYQKNGFLNTKVNINTIKDSVGLNNEKMVINVDLGDRVKVNEIEFSGNEIFKSKLLKKKMKKTKTKLPGRFWKKSKFIEDDYGEITIKFLVKENNDELA